MDLTGKLIIKVSLGDDIRRIPIHNEDITYDELVLMMQRVYRGQLGPNDEVTIKYKDEVNGQPQPLESNQLKHIRGELRQMRDRVNALIDSLEPDVPSVTGPTQTRQSPTDSGTAGEDPIAAGPAMPLTHPPVSTASSKEFDPLSSQAPAADSSTQNKVMSSFGLSNDAGAARPGTPDSISSVGSSASHQRTPQQRLPGQPGAAQVSQAVPNQAQSPYDPNQQLQQQQQHQQQQQQQQPSLAYQAQQNFNPQQPGGPQPVRTQQPQASYAGGQAQHGAPGGYPPAQSQRPQFGQQAGYPPCSSAGPGYPTQAPYASTYQQHQVPGNPQYSTPSSANYSQPGSASASSNPYSRGSVGAGGAASYGQYPRAQGEYPQTAYQQ